MKHTTIHTSKKLQAQIEKWVSGEKDMLSTGKLGKWNAQLFHLHRKKCWLVSNAFTKYNVILPDVKASDMADFSSIFKETFYGQLVYDGIITDYTQLEALIGQLHLMRTDNDRTTLSFQNQRLQDMEYWKNEFLSFEDMPIKDLNHRMNKNYIKLIPSHKSSDYTTSIEEMGKLLSKA
ncbi:DUF6933 domain-containing protein [Nonlabens xiamenensis]|uniref:DUF6933 domain-containing protein n=1 Tax=Nonlabens xiamenensis TaxID=2341043 RepID=UPI000F60D94A|nr:hypothetical protein [Nonlabens xiamenensis]